MERTTSECRAAARRAARVVRRKAVGRELARMIRARGVPVTLRPRSGRARVAPGMVRNGDTVIVSAEDGAGMSAGDEVIPGRGEARKVAAVSGCEHVVVGLELA